MLAVAVLLFPCSHAPSASLTPRAVDVPPPGQFSCAEQQAWGMCDALNGTAFCSATCEWRKNRSCMDVECNVAGQ